MYFYNIQLVVLFKYTFKENIMTTYLITGATGGYGSHAIKILSHLVPKENIFALVRSEEKGAILEANGINIRVADYSDKAALKKALAGIDKVLLVSSIPGNRQSEHQNVIDAAKTTDVKFIAYTSLAGADSTAANFSLGDDHRYTEKALGNSGIPFTSLRNNWYLENELPLITAALQSGTFIFATDKDSQVGWVSRNDLAEAGVKVLVTESPSQIVELSGYNLTYTELVESLNQATGRNITAKKGNIDDVIHSLVSSGFPADAAPGFASLQKAIAAGFLKSEKSDLEDILGRPATSISDSLKTLLS